MQNQGARSGVGCSPKVFFFRDKTEVFWSSGIQRGDALYGHRWVPEKLELQTTGELPEGGHSGYSMPNWFILSETFAVML